MFPVDDKWWRSFHKGLREQSKSIKCSPAPEVEQPTYKVVGEIERVDQRDTIIGRMMLKDPQSKEYREYYNQHPEYKEFDDKEREKLKKSIKNHFKIDPLGAFFQSNVFATRDMIGLPENVEPGREGNPLWETLETDLEKTDPGILTGRIKSYAHFLGATKVRITKLRKEWIYTHYAGGAYPNPRGERIDPDMNYKYVICIAMRQNPFIVQAGDNYIFCLEGGWRYAATSLVSITIANLIRLWGFRARALPPVNSPYMVVPTFVDAGIGEQGRMGIVVTKEFGNNFRPGGVATDMPLVIDKPVDFGLQDFCDKCKVCADACPSGAITKKDRVVARGVYRWQVNDEKCRAYWNHMGRPCAICQAACPWNFKSTWFHDFNRNLFQRFTFLRKSAVRGYKLFYEKKKWNPNPFWVFSPQDLRESIIGKEN